MKFDIFTYMFLFSQRSQLFETVENGVDMIQNAIRKEAIHLMHHMNLLNTINLNEFVCVNSPFQQKSI